MIMHNSKSIIHKILKEKSPIYDVQHIYLEDLGFADPGEGIRTPVTLRGILRAIPVAFAMKRRPAAEPDAP